MECTGDGNFDSLKSNPERLILFVDKHVRLQLIKNSSFIGFVHSIDPISGSIILSVPKVDNYKTILIPGHAIQNIEEAKPIIDASPPTRKYLRIQSAEETALVKNKIISWLKSNLLPAHEDGENIFFGNARLLPPFSIYDICTDNPMVALQVRKILEAMPPDFQPKE